MAETEQLRAVNTAWNYNADEETKSKSITTYKMDWSHFTRKDFKSNQVVLANLSSPLGAVETIRFASQRVNNIYSGTGLDPSVYAPSRAGASFLIQVNDVLTATESTTGTAVALPMSAHLVMRVPSNSAITNNNLVELFLRLLTALSSDNDLTLYQQIAQRLGALARGAVIPSELI